MNKLLCIVGPTGVGKTKRAIEESKKQPSILISADSRQVYRGMDIVTGKDHPKDISIFGIDIVNPDEPCSVAVWHDAVMPYILQAWRDDKLPIVVGGTGLYVKALTDGIETLQVPIDQTLRDKLTSLSITELQNKLKEIDSTKFANMNHSDQLNPRRLTRAIEIARFLHFGRNDESLSSRACREIPKDTEILGLKCIDDSNLPAQAGQRYRITERVMLRLKEGAIEETKTLLAKYGENIQSMSAIGYKSIIQYLEKSCSEQEMIENWVNDEFSYAKRQMTWFRKQSVIWTPTSS